MSGDIRFHLVRHAIEKMVTFMLSLRPELGSEARASEPLVSTLRKRSSGSPDAKQIVHLTLTSLQNKPFRCEDAHVSNLPKILLALQDDVRDAV